ncbi:hypothetical protein BHE74_00002931 [Ensete ventricosum]|uniref:Uncharacterized protein n=1 Tax=Ensete ventricosum TaxID=4639 RepID=A0A445MBI4_ENSVE|nr:hypothetical protein BHE74_00002931 [Ensete ventricosum]RZR71586.1 hypothetical protein BHM03_00005958 [Ensete ventricosum]
MGGTSVHPNVPCFDTSIQLSMYHTDNWSVHRYKPIMRTMLVWTSMVPSVQATHRRGLVTSDEKKTMAKKSPPRC